MRFNRANRLDETRSIPDRLVFVYGTLRAGFALHHYLQEPGARFLGAGTIRGRLYDLGPFPGARPATKRTDRIIGELYELPDSANKLEELDEVEEFYPAERSKSLFIRRSVAVQLAGGAKRSAWAYFLNKKPSAAQHLSHGDYLQHKMDSRSARARL